MFEIYLPINVTLTDGTEFTTDKLVWAFTDWGLIYTNENQATLIPWHRIQHVTQEKDC